MPLQFTDIDFRVDLPDISGSAPAAVHPAPCLRERA